MKDLFHNIGASAAIAFGTLVTSTSARTGNIVDLAGYESCTYLIGVGSTAGSTGAFTFSITAGNSSSLGDGAVVTNPDLIINTTAASWTMTSTGDDNTVERVGYKGSSRYIRLDVYGNSTKQGAVGSICVKGHPRSHPVTT
jgi:hypothetical protein